MLVIIGILSVHDVAGAGATGLPSRAAASTAFTGANTFAQLGMRTAFMFTMTAVVGGIVAARFNDPVFKKDGGRQARLAGD
jgi:hypothetical protein